MIARKVNELELLECHRISSVSFNWSLDSEGKTPEEYAAAMRKRAPDKESLGVADIWGAFTDAGDMMACLIALPYRVAFDGATADMRGIGGVCTYPHHRRKGAIKCIMRKMLDELYEKAVPFSYLYPFSEQFYARYGYHHACGGVQWAFDLAAIPESHIVGTMELYRPGEPIGDIISQYAPFARKWNMMVERDDMDWRKIQSADPFKGNTSAVLYRKPDGAPGGYVVFERQTSPEKGPILAGKELVFDSFDSLKALMGFIGTYISDYKTFTINMPKHLNLDHFCADFAQSKTAKTMQRTGMARAIHVEGALKQARCRGNGHLSLYVHDRFLPQNNGLYEITFQTGEANNVRFTRMPLSAFGQASDVEMTVNVLSAAILGGYDVADFGYMDGAAIHGDPSAVGQVFYPKPCWINDHF